MVKTVGLSFDDVSDRDLWASSDFREPGPSGILLVFIIFLHWGSFTAQYGGNPGSEAGRGIDQVKGHLHPTLARLEH